MKFHWGGPNVSCVSSLSIMCLVSILPVSLVCPLCVFSQYCLWLWFIHSLCLVSILLCLWFVHYVSCPNNACGSGVFILCLLPILPVSLVCPLCVLSQYCMCLWFDHFRSCLNTACVSGLSIMCLVSMLHVSLVCPFCFLSQKRMCLWFVHSVSCLNNACWYLWFVHSLCALSQCLPVSLVCPFCIRLQ